MKIVNTVSEILSAFADARFDRQTWWNFRGTFLPYLTENVKCLLFCIWDFAMRRVGQHSLEKRR